MKLHVLTACSRPQNLSVVAESLRAWGSVDVHWHVRFDPKRKHVGGQAVKNQMLDEIDDGWVWMLDDDCTAHPKLYRCLRNNERAVETEAIIVSQLREDGSILHAELGEIGVGSIDIGQAIMRRALIGDLRIPEEYAGDGEFLSAVLHRAYHLVFVDEVFSYHNNIPEAV